MKKIFILLFLLVGLGHSNLYAQATPDTVKIGCYVISLHDFDFKAEEYTARFWLWMVFKNHNLNFKDDVEVPNAKEIITDEYIEDNLDSLKWIQMRLKCKMKQSYKINDYPFDKQHLTIFVENSKFDANSVVFAADTVGKAFEPNLTVGGWQIKNFKVTTGISHYETGFGDTRLSKPETIYSHFRIDLDITRDAGGLFFKFFLGMYVAFAISFVSFFIDPQHVDPRFGLPVGGLFASVGNKYIVDGYLPDTSTLTIVDILHGLTFFFIFIIIAFSALSLRFDETGLNKKSKKTDRIVGWTMGVLYIIVNTVVILFAIFNEN
jgi:hypothetical protein